MITRNTLWGEEIVEDTKVCRDCKEEKPLDEFEPNRKFYDNSNPDGRIVRRPSCRKCRSNKKPISTAERKYWKRPKTFECPVCLYDYDGSYARLDHCHTTGDIRGWLCDNCNTGLGKFREDKEVLKRALKYLDA
jgi:hypothetical protein